MALSALGVVSCAREDLIMVKKAEIDYAHQLWNGPGENYIILLLPAEMMDDIEKSFAVPFQLGFAHAVYV